MIWQAGGKRRQQRRFVDVVKVDMQRVGVTEADARERQPNVLKEADKRRRMTI